MPVAIPNNPNFSPQANIAQKSNHPEAATFRFGLCDVVTTLPNAGDITVIPLPAHQATQVVLFNNSGVTINVYYLINDNVNYIPLLTATNFAFQGFGGSTQNIGIVRSDGNGSKAAVSLQMLVNW